MLTSFVCVVNGDENVAVYLLLPAAVQVAAGVTAFVVFTVCVCTLPQLLHVLEAVHVELSEDHV